MSDEKKTGFLKRAFGLKSKAEKEAERLAELEAQKQAVEREAQAHLDAINKAAAENLAKDQAPKKERQEKERQEKERQEKERLEKRVQEKIEAERVAAEKAQKEKVQKEKADKEKAEIEKRAKDQLEKERAEVDQAARDALKKEKEAQAKRAAEKAKAQRVAQEKADEEKAALEKLAAEKAAKDKREKAAQEKKIREDARIEKERLAQEKQAEEKATLEKLERDRLAAEKKEQETREREVLDRQVQEKAAAQQEQKAAQQEVAQKEEALKDKALKDKGLEEARKRAEKEAAPKPDTPAPEGDKTSFFQRMSDGLKRSTSRLSDNVSSVFTKRKLDDEALEELEDMLIASDLGVGPSMAIVETLSKDKFDKEVSDSEVKQAMASVISQTLTPLEKPFALTGKNPEVILFVGVNGSGKTTTLGKMALKFREQGKLVLIAAGDTFRAAANQQLAIWAERAESPIMEGAEGSDPAGLVYDAMERAKRDGYEVVMIDTAGRLQNRSELMAELEKIVRVIKKHDETAPHHVVLVLDATVGQNALSQAEAFRQTAGVTGLVMTKLDGTAKGGVLVALADKYKLPIHAIGIGEKIEDLADFNAEAFARALTGLDQAVSLPGLSR